VVVVVVVVRRAAGRADAVAAPALILAPIRIIVSMEILDTPQ
jgi:hypothetical protein